MAERAISVLSRFGSYKITPTHLHLTSPAWFALAAERKRLSFRSSRYWKQLGSTACGARKPLASSSSILFPLQPPSRGAATFVLLGSSSAPAPHLFPVSFIFVAAFVNHEKEEKEEKVWTDEGTAQRVTGCSLSLSYCFWTRL